MKHALARKPIVPIPEPQSPTPPRAVGSPEKVRKATMMSQRSTQVDRAHRRGGVMGRIAAVVAGWFVPAAWDEAPPVVDPRGMEALERHIRRWRLERLVAGRTTTESPAR